MMLNIPFDNSYARLPERFYAALAPMRVRAPALIRLNTALAEELGLDAASLAAPDGVSILSGNTVQQVPLPSRSPTRGISSAVSAPNWVMAGRCSWAR
jgi:serine/tyrosine/threonine adenylyltransferase